MTMTSRKTQRNNLGDAKTIKVEGRRDPGQEVRVQHGIVQPKWKAWQYEGFMEQNLS